MTPLADEQHRVVWDNIGLVFTIANDLQPWRQPEDDVMQAGVVGLIGAIQTFDPRFECEFSTHAYRRIQAAILQSEAKDRTIYIPSKDKRRDDKKYKANARQAKRVKSLAGFKKEPMVAREEQDAAERHDVWGAMRFLPSREREIVERSVVDEETLTSLAAKYGVTKQAVHQAKKKAIGRLRKMLASYAEVA